MSNGPEQILRQRDADIAGQLEVLLAAVEERGGLKQWRSDLRGLHADVERIQSNPDLFQSNVFTGSNGYLFNIGAIRTISTENMIDDEARAGIAIASSPAFQAILDISVQLKERGIDLIVVPIPNRSSFLAEMISDQAPDNYSVSPEMYALSIGLLRADVEVLDLWEPYLRVDDKEELYLEMDHHWSNLGVRIAARELGNRLRRYGFSSPNTTERKFKIAQREASRLGSSQLYLARANGEALKPARFIVDAVVDRSGESYRPSEISPVLIGGDSSVEIFSEVGGGLAAHLAERLNIPVSLLSMEGKGYEAHQALALDGGKALEGRRVLVWVLSSDNLMRHAYKYWKTVALPRP